MYNPNDRVMSYASLQPINKRSTPPQMMKYKLALQLHKPYYDETQCSDWLHLFLIKISAAELPKQIFETPGSLKLAKTSYLTDYSY